ncbi:hypothetical protein [Paraburkholderia sp. BCC1884]|uniref:hypothetical protein n=1 Tax=Paraburkholderia sp. BCC1884 TaxID=2562668 RepID=UPI001183D34A|nr:hypothetical protein [Paraburkholderia sp. BCC1884]
MADSVASTQSQPPRAASKTKRRQAAVSTETENKLARAARSAQRLAQLSDAARDDSTLDLFPDDPTRATLEAMNIDVRQGTLHGFELPDVVLAAVGAIDPADGASPDAKAGRRAPRAAKAEEPVSVNAVLSGLEIEPSMPTAAPAAELASDDDKAAGETTRVEEQSTAFAREATTALTPAMAAATVARSITALRQAAEPGTATDPATTSASAPTSTSALAGAKSTQRFAATFSKAASASRQAAGSAASVTNAVDAQSTSTENASSRSASPPVESKPDDSQACVNPANPVQTNAALAASSREAQRADAAAAALRLAPELDRARATAFADTVDALYGVIADQRHAATDHSRRMKWMLSIVVGALLVTVAIGITQTLLLMRLTRETTAQQHRIEEMMQNQQAAMASLLDSHIAVANAAAANAAPASVAATLATPAAPQPAGSAPVHAKRVARLQQHVHKPKPVASSH